MLTFGRRGQRGYFEIDTNAPMLIPRVFHTIWVQGALPESYRRWHESWLKYNPDWTHRLWHGPELRKLMEHTINEAIYMDAVNHAQRAEIASRHIIFEYGGVWVDADFECLRPIEPLLLGAECFVGEEQHSCMSAGIWGATPQHPLIQKVIDAITPSIEYQRQARLSQTHGAGPKILHREWSPQPDGLKVFPPKVFYPYLYDEPDPGVYGDAYAVHHWAATWKQ